MSEHDLGNASQTRVVADQVAEAAIVRFVQKHPELARAEIPAPLKWAGAIIAALFTVSVAGMAFWIVTSVSEMQVTLARMDERMANSVSNATLRLDAIEVRVVALETGERASR